jgi:hypothetical protein
MKNQGRNNFTREKELHKRKQVCYFKKYHFSGTGIWVFRLTEKSDYFESCIMLNRIPDAEVPA